MGLFDDILKDNETLFKNDVALDFSFHPKPLKYRDQEQRFIAGCIKPLLLKRNGRNVLVHGKPGIGKTLAVKQIFSEIEENYDEVVPVFINCWQKNTTYKIVMDICEQIGYKFTQNKKTEDLLKIIISHLNKQNAAFAFDEVDKMEDYDFLYTFLEQIYRKSIILISNHKEWLINLDARIKSRLNPEQLDFRSYTLEETKGILEQRKESAFVSKCWKDEAFNVVVEKAFEFKDIRTGLYLMKEAGTIAEENASRIIEKKHVDLAIGKLDELSLKQLDLEEEIQFVLDIIKLNTGKKIGELYKIYQENGGKSSYKTFTRKIDKLKQGKFVTVKTILGGDEGTTSIVTYQSMEKQEKI